MIMEQQQAFRAVADTTRRAIIDLLTKEEMNAGEIAKHFTMSRPAVAKHLRILKDCGIVAIRRSGRRRIHRLRPEGLKILADWISHYEQFWSERLTDLKSEIEENN